MEVTLEKTSLQFALDAVSRIVPKDHALPILNNIHLSTQGDQLLVTGSDMEVFIRVAVPASVFHSGSVVLPYKAFADYISKLSSAPIVIEAAESKVQVRSGHSKIKVSSKPGDDFPSVPVPEWGVEFNVPTTTLKTLLRMSAFAASKERRRTVLEGVLFEVDRDSLSLVATDKHRLARCEAKLVHTVATPQKVVIPSAPLVELERILKSRGDDEVRVRIGHSQVHFESREITLVARLVDGQFPNYARVIPESFERTVILSRAELMDALARISVVAESSRTQHRAIFSFEVKGSATLKIDAISSETGEAHEEIPITCQGPGLKIAYNVSYLWQALSMLDLPRDADYIELRSSGPLSAGVLRVVGKPEWSYVLMPMQI